MSYNNKSYFLRKMEFLENSLKNKEAPKKKDTFCPYCFKPKNPWATMCQQCYFSGAYKNDPLD